MTPDPSPILQCPKCGFQRGIDVAQLKIVSEKKAAEILADPSAEIRQQRAALEDLVRALVPSSFQRIALAGIRAAKGSEIRDACGAFVAKVVMPAEKP
jgi:hypothetical protein